MFGYDIEKQIIEIIKFIFNFRGRKYFIYKMALWGERARWKDYEIEFGIYFMNIQ